MIQNRLDNPSGALRIEFLRLLEGADEMSAAHRRVAGEIRRWATTGLSGLALRDRDVVQDSVDNLCAIFRKFSPGPGNESPHWALAIQRLEVLARQTFEHREAGAGREPPDSA